MNTATHRCGQTGTEQCYSKVGIAEKLIVFCENHNQISHFRDNKLLSKGLGGMVKSIAKEHDQSVMRSAVIRVVTG